MTFVSISMCNLNKHLIFASDPGCSLNLMTCLPAIFSTSVCFLRALFAGTAPDMSSSSAVWTWNVSSSCITSAVHDSKMIFFVFPSLDNISVLFTAQLLVGLELAFPRFLHTIFQWFQPPHALHCWACAGQFRGRALHRISCRAEIGTHLSRECLASPTALHWLLAWPLG